MAVQTNGLTVDCEGQEFKRGLTWSAPTPTGFAELVGDDFPVLHAWGILPLQYSTTAMTK